MKRTLTLLVLIGLVTGAMLTGCGDNSGTKAPDSGKAPDAGTAATNAAPAAPK